MCPSDTDLSFEDALALAAESTPIAAAAPEPPTKPYRVGTITYYPNLIQGSDEWAAARCGLLTASEMKLIITPTLKIASNDKERSHLYELLAQRITKYVEPHYVSEDMLRGHVDEVEARNLYAEHYAPVQDMGFITNDRFGFAIGFSPDGLIGADGFIECKSRRQKYQIETITECVAEGLQPIDYLLQTQTGFLVSERQFCEFISFSGGLPMVTIRVWPDAKVMNAIAEAAGAFEERLAAKLAKYHATLKAPGRMIPTERRIAQEMFA